MQKMNVPRSRLLDAARFYRSEAGDRFARGDDELAHTLRDFALKLEGMAASGMMPDNDEGAPAGLEPLTDCDSEGSERAEPPGPPKPLEVWGAARDAILSNRVGNRLAAGQYDEVVDILLTMDRKKFSPKAMVRLAREMEPIWATVPPVVADCRRPFLRRLAYSLRRHWGWEDNEIATVVPGILDVR